MCIRTILFLSLFFIFPLFFCIFSITDAVLDKDVEVAVFGVIVLLFFSIFSVAGAIAVYGYEVANLL